MWCDAAGLPKELTLLDSRMGLLNSVISSVKLATEDHGKTFAKTPSMRHYRHSPAIKGARRFFITVYSMFVPTPARWTRLCFDTRA
jgi:hypothetical protein